MTTFVISYVCVVEYQKMFRIVPLAPTNKTLDDGDSDDDDYGNDNDDI